MVGITKSEFAKIAGVGKSAISNALKKGLLVEDAAGFIDPENELSQLYLLKRGVDSKAEQVGVLPPLSAKSKKADENCSSELLRENLRLKNNKLRLEIEVRRGQLLDRDRVHDSVFRYLDEVYRNLERLSSVYLDDVKDRIISIGALTPEIRGVWRQQVLTAIDDAKNETVKKLKELGSNE